VQQDAVRLAFATFSKKMYGKSVDWEREDGGDSSGDEGPDDDVTPIKSVRKTQASKRRRTLTMQEGGLAPHQEQAEEGA
jgi:hypothetical protein